MWHQILFSALSLGLIPIKYTLGKKQQMARRVTFGLCFGHVEDRGNLLLCCSRGEA